MPVSCKHCEYEYLVLAANGCSCLMISPIPAKLVAPLQSREMVGSCAVVQHDVVIGNLLEAIRSDLPLTKSQFAAALAAELLLHLLRVWCHGSDAL